MSALSSHKAAECCRYIWWPRRGVDVDLRASLFLPGRDNEATLSPCQRLPLLFRCGLLFPETKVQRGQVIARLCFLIEVPVPRLPLVLPREGVCPLEGSRPDGGAGGGGGGGRGEGAGAGAVVQSVPPLQGHDPAPTPTWPNFKHSLNLHSLNYLFLFCVFFFSLLVLIASHSSLFHPFTLHQGQTQC